MQANYALCATVFFSIFLVSTIVYGGDTARFLATIAAFVGAYSQFAAQDRRPWAWRASILLAYAGMALGLAALWFWK